EKNDRVAVVQLDCFAGERRVAEDAEDRTGRTEAADGVTREQKRRIVPGIDVLEASVRREHAVDERAEAVLQISPRQKRVDRTDDPRRLDAVLRLDGEHALNHRAEKRGRRAFSGDVAD